MSFERGWPFSVQDQMLDLRYEVSKRGFLRGYPAWIWGQASRLGEIARASRVEGEEEARARQASSGWDWDLFRGRHYRYSPGVPKGLAIIAAFIGFYLQLFFIVVFLTAFLALTPLFALLSVLSVIDLSLATAAVSGVYAAIGFKAIQWLRSGDVEARPNA